MKTAVKVLAIVALFSVLAMSLVWIFWPAKPVPPFVPPVHDEDAVLGTPTPDKQYGYAQGPLNDYYDFFVATTPRLVNGEILLFLTNPEKNNALLRVKVYNGDDLIAESGYLNPGEYLEAVSAPDATPGTIHIKVMSYEPETWYSLGPCSMSIPLALPSTADPTESSSTPDPSESSSTPDSSESSSTPDPSESSSTPDPSESSSTPDPSESSSTPDPSESSSTPDPSESSLISDPTEST